MSSGEGGDGQGPRGREGGGLLMAGEGLLITAATSERGQGCGVIHGKRGINCPGKSMRGCKYWSVDIQARREQETITKMTITIMRG